MPKFLLRVKGTIDLTQFWPHGTSDADTTKVVVTTHSKSFQYGLAPNGPFKSTPVFSDARIGRKQVITKQGKMTVRLQGIDAPELHYRSAPLPQSSGVSSQKRNAYNTLNKDFRQFFAETSTVALANRLKQAGNNNVPCTVLTLVEEPGDAFDKYGRFVGDIQIRVGNKDMDINRWLVGEGWAFPAFYNSMEREEIRAFLADWEKGKRKQNRLWKNFQRKIGRLDWKLTLRPKGSAPDPVADAKRVILPKLFRRLVEWEVKKKAGVESVRLGDFLTQKDDVCFTTDDFLSQTRAAKARKLVEFLDKNLAYRVGPEDIVFKESTSTLRDKNGKEITQWQ